MLGQLCGAYYHEHQGNDSEINKAVELIFGQSDILSKLLHEGKLVPRSEQQEDHQESNEEEEEEGNEPPAKKQRASEREADASHQHSGPNEQSGLHVANGPEFLPFVQSQSAWL